MIINIVRIWTFSNKLVGSVVSFWANESDIKTEKFLSDKSLKILKDLLVISFEWFSLKRFENILLVSINNFYTLSLHFETDSHKFAQIP